MMALALALLLSALLLFGAQTLIQINQVDGLDERLYRAELAAIVETWNLTAERSLFSITEHRYGPTVMVWVNNRLMAGCIGNVVECAPGYEWMLDGAYVQLVDAAPAGARVTIRLLIPAEFLNSLNLTMTP